MRQVKKEDAIREYGVHYVPSLDGFGFDLHSERAPVEPRDALAKKLEKLSESPFDGTIHMIEKLGAPTQDFHFKDLQDVHQRYETEKRAGYQQTFEALGETMTDPANVALLEKAAKSEKTEQQRLKAAFEKAYEKLVGLEAFLSSRLSFKVGITYLDDVVTLPDTIAQAGDTVYVVKDDGKAIPSLVEGIIVKREFSSSFWGKIDFAAHYEIDAGDPPPGPNARIDKTYVSFSEGSPKAPAGGVAGGLDKIAFNTKAAAEKHIGNALDARETELKAQMKQIRTVRKQLGKNTP